MYDPSAARLRAVHAAIFVLILSAIMEVHSASAAGAPKPNTSIAPPHFDSVFIVVLENHSYSQVVGSPMMPYLNALIANYGLAANYYANAHPSIGNYFMLTTGAAITNNDNYTGTIKVNNVVRILNAAHLTWRVYIENKPSNPMAGDADPYIKHHDPFAYLSDVVNDAAQQANLVDFSELAADIAANSLPAYGFVVPNMYDSGDQPLPNAPNTPDQLSAQADAWLQQKIDPLISSAAFQNGGLLIITYDEGNGSDKRHGGGQVATVIVSPMAKHGYKSAQLYQHQSTLRLMLQGLSITQFPGAAAHAPQMGEFFNQ